MLKVIISNIFPLIPGVLIYLIDNIARYIFFDTGRVIHIYAENIFDCKIWGMRNVGSALVIAISDQYISRAHLLFSGCILALLSYWFIRGIPSQRKILLGTLICCSFFSLLDRLQKHHIFNFLDLDINGIGSFQINLFDITSILCIIFVCYGILRRKIRNIL